MSRFNVLPGLPGEPSPQVGVNRYQDAALIMRVEGEAVPNRSDFGTGWSLALVGRGQIETTADRLNDYAGNERIASRDKARAQRVAEELRTLAPAFQALSEANE